MMFLGCTITLFLRLKDPTVRIFFFLLIGNSRKYIREGQKAAPHTKGILSTAWPKYI